MTNADNSLELSSDEVNNRLDELYAELKTLKPYLPFQQIKRVLAELKWIISMRENSSVQFLLINQIYYVNCSYKQDFKVPSL